MFFYCAWLMMHFIDVNKTNFPYFLLSSLRKMVTNIQRKIKTIGSSLYHCGLVKKLIEAHFNSKGDNWEDFLV